MKQTFQLFLAALLGGIVASLMIQGAYMTSSAVPQMIRAKEFALVDDRGKMRARLYSEGTETLLRYYTEEGEAALELSADRKGLYRQIVFFGRKGTIPVALNSTPPHGEGTLYLGSEMDGTRMIIGAFHSDMPASPGERSNWGIDLRAPFSSESLFRVLATPADGSLQSGAAVAVKRLTGRMWSVY